MRALVPLLLSLTACQPTVSIGRHGTTDEATDDAAVDASTGEQTTPPSGDGGSTGASSTSASSSGGTIDWCAPELADNRCTTCTKIFCCETFEACATDAFCSCYWGCVSSMGTGMSAGCTQVCDPPDINESMIYSDLLSCAYSTCLPECQ